VVEDDKLAGEEFADVDLVASIGAAGDLAWEQDGATADAGAVIAAHDAGVAAAEEEIEIGGRATPDGARLLGRAREAPIEGGDERRQEGIRPLEGDGQAQGGGALAIADAPGQRGLHQARARDFLPAHRECLHGATFSRSS
jgi:hypothetical protein